MNIIGYGVVLYQHYWVWFGRVWFGGLWFFRLWVGMGFGLVGFGMVWFGWVGFSLVGFGLVGLDLVGLVWYFFCSTNIWHGCLITSYPSLHCAWPSCSPSLFSVIFSFKELLTMDDSRPRHACSLT